MYFVEGVSNSEAFDGFGVWKMLFKNFVHGFEKRNFKTTFYSSVYYYKPENFLATSPFYLFFKTYIYIPQLFLIFLNKTPPTFGK